MIVVPPGMPMPAIVCPTAIGGPLVNADTVSTLLVIEPVNEPGTQPFAATEPEFVTARSAGLLTPLLTVANGFVLEVPGGGAANSRIAPGSCPTNTYWLPWKVPTFSRVRPSPRFSA